MPDPGYWMHETSGVLRPAVIAYMRGDDLTESEVATLRAYLRQWAAGSFMGIDDLRERIDGLTTGEAIDAWAHDAMERGLDPF